MELLEYLLRCFRGVGGLNQSEGKGIKHWIYYVNFEGYK